jgi:hypothetical protein
MRATFHLQAGDCPRPPKERFVTVRVRQRLARKSTKRDEDYAETVVLDAPLTPPPQEPADTAALYAEYVRFSDVRRDQSSDARNRKL